MNATPNTSNSTGNLVLKRLDFGMGLLAGLHIKGVDTLDEADERNLHAAFHEAYEVVRLTLGRPYLLFSITPNQSRGTSADAFNIFSHWLTLWAKKEAPSSTLWTFTMTDQRAEDIFSRIPGDREMYLKAAAAFLKRYHNQ